MPGVKPFCFTCPVYYLNERCMPPGALSESDFMHAGSAEKHSAAVQRAADY